jgi:lipopolysaccharide transport protein LptA
MRNALKLVLLLSWPLFALPAASTGSEAGSDKETIVIRADRAWEEADGGQVLHFAGNFELISPEWELRSDEAELYGPLDDPIRIVARGAPAYLTILDEERTIEGEGLVIEYQRDEDVLILRQNAKLSGDDISMTSSEITFDVAEERLRSSGTDGVEMVLERAR